MKKNILCGVLLAALGAMATTSCGDPTSEGVTQITYHAKLTINGDAATTVNRGDSYEDAGCTAVMKGEDVTDKVIVKSNVDTSKSGVYTVTYSVTNADGFTASTSRKVYVYDKSNVHEGLFYSTADSYRDYNGAQTAYGGNYSVFIMSNEDGSYSISDLFGGWYDQRAGYGSSYAMAGNATIDDEGTVTLLDSYVSGWGDSLVDFEGTFNADSTMYKLTSTYVSDMVFHITLTK